MAPKMNMRFRKTFPLLGNWLKWTVSKKGISLNLRAGPLSKSWGTRGKSTTIDAPGAFGFFWRKESRRGAGGASKLSADEQAVLADAASQRLWTRLAYAVIAVEAAIEAAHIWVHPFSEVEVTGHPGLTLFALVAAQLGLVALAKSYGLRFGIFFLTLVGAYVQWKLFGALAWDNVNYIETTPEKSSPPKPGPGAGD